MTIATFDILAPGCTMRPQTIVLKAAPVDEFLDSIERYKDEFYRFILRNVWDSGVAEDVFSQAVLAAYENRQKYTPGTNFRAWMYRILLNKCYVANRETGRAFDPLEGAAENKAIAPEPRADYGNLMDNPQEVLEQCGDEVYSAFRNLSTAQRTSILLRGVEKFSYQEIAEIMEIPVGTVMTHLSRGRRKLRELLGEYARETGIIRTAPHLRVREKDSRDSETSQGGASS